MRRAGLHVVLIATAITAGCQRKAAPTTEPATPVRDAGPGAPTAPTAPIGPRTHALPPIPSRFPPEPVPPMPRELRFVLLDAGQGRRTVLRYRGDAPARALSARAQIASKAYADGVWSGPQALAPVRDGFGITVEARPDGGATLHLRGLEAALDATGATPAAVTAAEAYVARWRTLLEARRADVTIDARGRLLEAALLDDPRGLEVDARDELVQRWLGLVVPVPAEAVAPGARWRVISVLRAGGAVLKQTATYQLVSATAAGWTVEVTIERIGEPQDIVVPGVPGALGELVALRRQVKGTLTVTAADPLPVRGTLTAEVASHARFRGRGGALSERYTEDTATIDLAPP